MRQMVTEKVDDLFDQYAIPDPFPAGDRRGVFPISTYEALTGISVKDSPLFFHPNIFVGGADFNCASWNDEQDAFELRYFTYSGLVKAIAIANAELLWRSTKKEESQC